LSFYAPGPGHTLSRVTVETFRPEISQALRAYDKFVVCLDRSPDHCQATLFSLMKKAIEAYDSRGPNLRHGIALDKYFTVILSQSDAERPRCAIYFNLHTPYLKQAAPAAESCLEKTGPEDEPPMALA
jgi:hypothetical protein